MTYHGSCVYSCPLNISESILWSFPGSNFLKYITTLPQIMLVALTKILTSFGLGAGILEGCEIPKHISTVRDSGFP